MWDGIATRLQPKRLGGRAGDGTCRPGDGVRAGAQPARGLDLRGRWRRMACERYEAAVKAAPRRRLDPLGNRLLILQGSSPPYAMARICHFCIFMHNSAATWQESGLSVGTTPPSCYRNTGFLPIRAMQGARRLQESPILAIEHPLRHVRIQKGLFLATERYSVLNYAARFALPRSVEFALDTTRWGCGGFRWYRSTHLVPYHLRIRI